MASYWDKVLKSRIGRRRALIRAGGFAVGAALIAACGGDDDGSTAGGRDRGILTPVEDASEEAVRGGTLHSNASNVWGGLDIIRGTHGGFRVQNSPYYNRIFQALPGVLQPSNGEIIGDVADSWEWNGDGTQLTIKLRPNLGTDPRPPLEGRNLDAHDVKFSWDLFAAESTVRSTLANSVDPNAPIESIEMLDEQTLAINLAFPSALLEGYLTDGFFFWIMPREAESKYDPRNEAHGAGPYYNSEFVADARLQLTRNPNYYDPKLPYIDVIEVPALAEPAALLAQFEAANIDVSSTIFGDAGVTNDNVLDVHQRHPEMTLFEVPGGGTGTHLRVGYAEDSIFRDVRARRAISMAMNREDLVEFWTNQSRLVAAGLPMEPVWAGHLSPIYPGVPDLRDDFFAEFSQYFEYNPSEAKKLIEAAGWNGDPIPLLYSNLETGLRDGPVLADQLRLAGMETTEQVLDAAAEFIPTVARRNGDYQGIGVHVMVVGYGFEHYIYSSLHPTSASAASGPGILPELTSINNAIFGELDGERRQALMRDWMLRAAEDMPSVPVGAISPTYQLAWPWIRNVGVFQRWLGTSVNNVEVFTRYWYDESKDTRT